MAKKIIIDTDPGVDDTIAILTALRSPEVEVIGLTSVFGNVPGEIAAQNALRLVELEGHGDIPVARGSDVPLVFPLEKLGTWVHGEDGMGNTQPPAPKGKVVDKSAAEFIVEMAHAYPGEVTLVPVGPLTNIALALRIDPGIAALIKEVVIMGGAVANPGNMTPVAEANIYHDPHAADIVMAAGWPLVLVGLDVTHKTIITPEFQQMLFKAGNPAVELISKVLPCYQNFFNNLYGLNGAIYTHDPSAISYVINPDLFTTKDVPVFVETEGRCVGQTVADWAHQWEERTPVKVCLDVNSEGVLALLKERLTA
ncbi:nucleoside hydrolase [Pelolinea submarina]|uniref:Uridine nucleosidase n=1 Tax=Pelolinea submarina TaxID=913107 RepID=A0A347ZVL9_9CHLR|nr:nucleoside hydrolase [Pelolinea submarina]REG07045.1 uridine nucleosidase [Pelolinea submarina]BBB49350.1 uridine nucleosidase [Pelolinea submarina]